MNADQVLASGTMCLMHGFYPSGRDRPRARPAGAARDGRLAAAALLTAPRLRRVNEPRTTKFTMRRRLSILPVLAVAMKGCGGGRGGTQGGGAAPQAGGTCARQPESAPLLHGPPPTPETVTADVAGSATVAEVEFTLNRVDDPWSPPQEIAGFVATPGPGCRYIGFNIGAKNVGSDRLSTLWEEFRAVTESGDEFRATLAAADLSNPLSPGQEVSGYVAVEVDKGTHITGQQPGDVGRLSVTPQGVIQFNLR